jgi:hypothetical protein
MNMVSTIAVTTVNSLATIDLSTWLSIFCTIFLTCLLILKELLNSTEGARKRYIARSLDIAIVPLLLSFTIIMALEVVEILS